jgi:CheY-like chemotaxis protein
MAHKLLLADDSVTIQRVIELTFADEDVDVTTVGDGQLAIERLDADRFDIVLADVDMPKRDGYEVAAYVKSRPKLAHIPVVLLTGAFEPIDQARADAAGSSDVLAKPFEPQMVINRVKELLGHKTGGDSQNRFSPAPGSPGPAMPPKPPAHTPAEPQAQQTGVSASSVSLDDYFDQLDAAFSSLQPSAAAAPVADTQSAHSDMDWNSFMEPDGQPAQPLSVAAPAPGLKPVLSAPAPTRAAAPSAWPAPPIVPVPVSSPAPPVSTAPIPTAVRPSPTMAPWAPAPTSPAEPPQQPVLTPVSASPAPAPASYAAPQAHAAPVVSVAHAAPAHAAPSPAPKTAAPASATNPFASLSAVKAELAAAAAARPAAPIITEEIIEDVVARVLQRLSDRVVRETVTEIVASTAERAVREEIERIKAGGE